MEFTLPIQHFLQSRYRIEKVTGQGGFGITYKAFDERLKKNVCIKELYVSGSSTRGENNTVNSQAVGTLNFAYFKEKFLDEAQKLAGFNHSGIVKVLDYFEENNTAYMVMEFVEGKNLKQYVEENGALTEEEAMNFFLQLLDAVEEIHENKMLHRDIKPENILITPKKQVVLIDFGTAKFQVSEDQTTFVKNSTIAVLSPKYAPPEQYQTDAPKEPYTDVYALGATFYYMLTAVEPKTVQARAMSELQNPQQIVASISKPIDAAIIKAMELKPDLRFQSVQAFRNALQQTEEIPPTHPIIEVDEEEEKLWKKICLLDDKASYKYYIVKFPDGKYTKNAKNRINEINDDLLLFIITLTIIGLIILYAFYANIT